MRSPRHYREGGWPWLSAGCIALSLLMVIALLILLATRGLAHFWPSDVEQVTLEDGSRLAGQRTRQVTVQGETQLLYYTANRDLDGQSWRWVEARHITAHEKPTELILLERQRWGDFIGRLVALHENARPITQLGDDNEALWQALTIRLERAETLRLQRQQLRDQQIEPLARQLQRANEGEGEERQRDQLASRLEEAQARLARIDRALERDTLMLESADGRLIEQPLGEILAVSRPNAMSWIGKLGSWSEGVWNFLSEGPRAANMAGGVWPAIFGTVLMVLLMSLLVTPFGVLTAIYLNEVARQGPVIRLVRIAVRNLAGVPSIVYGVFGLGVFVYGIGGSLDQWFFDERLPSPTFGTGGLLWASLTLALLTLPVVIVATEEGLARIPDQQREAALALGATRYEMLRRVVLPMAVPAMLTGVILAVARAAGEVAPLMLVGAAKLATQLPVNSEFPFLHLESKFMHLGYHLYNVGFQGEDMERAMPLVFATSLLLVMVIVLLNLTAIFLRHHLRTRHHALV